MKALLVTALALAAPLILIAPAASAQADIDAAFTAMDANKDGRVDKAEFTRFSQAKQTRQTEALDTAFRTLDKDSDGKLDKTEAAANPIIANVFEALDADHDGGLSHAEMRSALAQAQAQEAAK